MQKIMKRILAYTLTLAIILSTLVFGAVSTVSAEAATEFVAWDGSTDTNLEGSGTEADPYLVKTAAQLAAVVSSTNDNIELSQSQALRTTAVIGMVTELPTAETEPTPLAPVTAAPSFLIVTPTLPIAVGVSVIAALIR